MKPNRLYLALLTGISLCAQAATETSTQETTLYCTGSSWQSVAGNSASQVDALVKVSSKSFYIEISAVAFGKSNKAPKAIGSMTVSNDITLTRAYQGGGTISAGYSLNRYDGSLMVYPNDKYKKLLFVSIEG